MANNTYTSLITKVIQDFDSIYDALRAKGVTKSGVALPEDRLGTTTTQYAGLITDNLIAIEGEYNLGNAPLANYSKNDSKTAIGALTGVTLTASGTSTTSYTVMAQGLAEGYYNTNSYIYTTINVENIEFSPTGDRTSTIKDSTDTSKITGYLVTPSNNKLISSVSITKGSVTASIDTTKESEYKLETEYTSTSTLSETNTIQVSDAANTWTSGSVSFKYNTSVTRTGTLTVNPNVVKSAGYITENDVSVTGISNLDIGNTYTTGEKTFYIKKGTLKDIALPSTTTASIGGAGVTWIDPKNNPKNFDYITLNAAIKNGTSNELTVTGTLDEGYITGNADGTINLGTVTIDAGEAHIKKGSITNITGNAGKVALTLTDNDGINAAQNATSGKDQYELTVAIGTAGAGQTLTGEVVDGYIDATSYTAAISGNTSIFVDKGSVTLNAKATLGTATGDNGIITTTAPTKSYSIEVAPVIDMTGLDSVEGYITANDIKEGKTTQTPTTFYVAHGDAVVNAGLDIELVPGTAADGEHAGYNTDKTVIDIFETAAPTDKDGKTLDHYKILATASKGTINQGYMSSSDITANPSEAKYLRKADVKWVEEKDGDIVKNAYLEVLTGGYLPSGIISTIDTDSTPSFATVKLGAGTNSSAIFKASAAAQTDYVLNVAKTTATSAGYISGSEGQGSVNGTFYVAQGAASLENGVGYGTIAAPAPVLSGQEGDENRTVTGYTISVPVIATATLGLTEGYIELANVELNKSAYSETNNKIVVNDTKVITLEKATLATKAGTQAISLSVTPEGIQTTDIDPETKKPFTSSYAVTPKITGDSTITIAPSKAGYLATTDETVINVLSTTQGDVETIYIKPGRGGKIGEKDGTANTVAATITFTEPEKDEAGKSLGYYKGTVGGEITAAIELAEGYYGSTEKSIHNNVAITGAEFSVAQGSFAIENTIAPDLTPSENALFTTPSEGEGDDKFITVTTATTVTSDKTTKVPGYTKDEDVTVSNKVFTETTKYIRKVTSYTVAQAEAPATIDADVVAAKQTVSVPVANKFATQDVTVTLHADAMGTNVAKKLRELEARLAGARFTEA